MDNATNRVLDELASRDKAAGGTGTDYKLAQVIGVTPQQVSKWRSGRDQMGDAMAIRVAELLGVQPLRLIGEISAEKARDTRTKKFWQATVKANGGKVAAVILSASLGSGIFTPASDLGRGNGPSLLENPGVRLCILC